MKDNFDLKKYLTENRLTPLSKHSKEHPDFINYKGAKYRRVGLVNENQEAPIVGERQNVFSGPAPLWDLEATENLGDVSTEELYSKEMKKYIMLPVGSNFQAAEAIKQYCRLDFGVADTGFVDAYFKFPMGVNFRTREAGAEDIHQALVNAFYPISRPAAESIRTFQVGGFLLRHTGEADYNSGVDAVDSETSNIYLLKRGFDNIEDVLQANGEYRGQF